MVNTSANDGIQSLTAGAVLALKQEPTTYVTMISMFKSQSNFMVQDLPLHVHHYSAGPYFSEAQRFYYLVQKSMPLDPMLNQFNHDIIL
jgi:hypothetical protein